MSDRVQVCLTADIEFSIAGAFRDPDHAMPLGEQNVRCLVGDRSAGLGFMLDTLRAHGLRATFFVEALNSLYFGDAPMRDIAREIQDAGHDVQLHLHPCWTYFANPDWRDRLAADPPADDFAMLSPESVRELIQRGLDIFRRWGLPRPVALRTGGLCVSRTVYREMAAAGLRIASNIGVGIRPPAETELHLYAGRHRIEGVIEAPVLSYARFVSGRPYKSLTIVGSVWPEIEQLLRVAARSGTSPVVLLTHAHEFVVSRADDLGLRYARANVATQTRLRKLCHYLANHADAYEVTTLGKAGPDWLGQSDTANPLYSVGYLRGLLGVLKNRFALDTRA
jgi:hypothetical protein